MSVAFKPTLVDAPPAKRTAAGGRPGSSKYASLIDYALEHEGQWVRCGIKAPPKRVRSVATVVRSLVGRTVKRLGLRGAFEVMERVDESGQMDVYLRKLPANGAPK